MKSEIIKVETIAEFHKAQGFEKPLHPLISLIDARDLWIPEELIGKRVTTGFYTIALKDSGCGMIYGRNQYDFSEGVMSFVAPNQIHIATQEVKIKYGWMLMFHPDLIRNSNLGKQIDSYTFFSYEVHEALHLSEKEEKTITDLIHSIKDEYEERIDNHSQRVLVSSLELLLNYCTRFYERQFNTRSTAHSDTLAHFEAELKEYFNSEKLTQYGPPSVQYLADKVNLSPNYLGDLLKKESGMNPKDHINEYVVEKAKNMLIGTEESISTIAYDLGFNYPHYFSRLFKSKTGFTPQEFRETSE